MGLIPEEAITSVDQYVAAGGGRALARARQIGPDAIIDEVARSGLRGRGGAGFPTGTKWRSVRRGGLGDRYAVANGAEGEPGTYKDRAILRFDPYQVVEGLAVAAFAVGAAGAYLAVKAKETAIVASVRRALEEMAAAHLAGDVPMALVEGPDEYLFGEEKALLEVIEGNDALPRILPPWQHGLFASNIQLGWSAGGGIEGGGTAGAHPTVVNNVETLAHVTHIVADGPGAFTDSMIFTVSGDVERPGIYEFPLRTPLRTLVEGAGGATDVKMVISGVANNVLTPGDLDLPMHFDTMGLGSGGFVVYDHTRCAVDLAVACSRFLARESCGQCPACKLGTAAITEALAASDFAVVAERLENVSDGNRCYLPIEEIRVVGSLLEAFPDDVAQHVAGTCPLPHDLVVPSIREFDDARGTFVWDP